MTHGNHQEEIDAMEITAINVKLVRVDQGKSATTEFGLQARVEPGEDLEAAYKEAYLTLLGAVGDVESPSSTEVAEAEVEAALSEDQQRKEERQRKRRQREEERLQKAIEQQRQSEERLRQMEEQGQPSVSP
jgi:hypothetical protein